MAAAPQRTADAAGPAASDVVGWLTPDEMRAWRGLVDLIVPLLAEQDEALATGHGINEGEYAVLVHLSEAEGGRLRMCDLAAALRLSPSGLTRRIDGLARKGLVARAPSEEDRRVQLAVLTDDGMAKLEAAAPTHVAAVRRSLIDHLSERQLRTLAELVERAQESRHRAGL
jgi:DNA-binding MarR family transcriptional regulator